MSQISDVKPTDWAYQALSYLVDRNGCVAGYPSGTFKGGQSMTRYEAAALLSVPPPALAWLETRRPPIVVGMGNPC